VTGPEQHAATVREALKKAGVYRSATFAALDELVALAGRADESDLEHQSDRRAYWRERAEAAEARADELQRERDEQYLIRIELESETMQARREADQLRAALRAIKNYEWYPGQPAVDIRAIARAALAGVQADNKDSAADRPPRDSGKPRSHP